MTIVASRESVIILDYDQLPSLSEIQIYPTTADGVKIGNIAPEKPVLLGLFIVFDRCPQSFGQLVDVLKTIIKWHRRYPNHVGFAPVTDDVELFQCPEYIPRIQFTIRNDQ